MSEENLKDVEMEVQTTEKKEEGLDVNYYLDKLFKTENLFEKIAVAFMSILVLGFIYSVFKIIKMDDLSDVFSYVSSQKFIKFFVILMFLLIGLMVGKVFYNKKNINSFLTKGNIFMCSGTLFFAFGTYYINNIIRLANASKKALTGQGLFDIINEIGSNYGSLSGTDFESYVSGRVKVTTFCHFIGVVLFVVAIIFILKTFSNNEKLNKIANIVDSKVDGAVNAAKNIDRDEVENTVKETAEKTANFFQKFKKQIILGVSALAIVFVGIFGFRTIREMNRPDAVVSLSKININAEFSGVNENGKIKVFVEGTPVITEVKKGKNKGEIQNVIEYEIVLDKKDGYRNGDEVKVVVKYNNPKEFKLKFDKTEIEKTFKVENLKEVVTKISDISDNHLDRIEKKVVESISKGIYRDYKNLKVQKLKSFEKELDSSKENSYVEYNIVSMYKVEYEMKKVLSDEYEKSEYLVLYRIEDFNKKGENLDFYVNKYRERKFVESEVEDLTNRLKVEGYRELN